MVEVATGGGGEGSDKILSARTRSSRGDFCQVFGRTSRLVWPDSCKGESVPWVEGPLVEVGLCGVTLAVLLEPV